MTRGYSCLVLAAVVAGCSGGSELPGAILRGPGALAVFDGFAAHDSGSLRPYLAIANERGDELRLLDTTDYEVVTSPGLVYPLSIPISGRPLLMASADLNDGLLVDGVRNLHDRPDALVVVAAGSSEVELVDTWSGLPTVVATVPLPANAEVLSMAGVAIPGAVGSARILVGLSGGRLAVLEATRVAASEAVTLTAVATLTLGFDVVSLAQGGAPALNVYAASRDELPGAVFGVARLALPADLTGWLATTSVTALDALAPTEAVAVASAASWTFPNPGSGTVSDLFTDAAPLAERVVAVPVAAECGDGKPVRCGLLALDPTLASGGPTLGHLVRRPATTPPLPDPEPYLLPITLPAPVAGILATGRAAANLVPIVSGAGTVSTSALAAVATTDGRIYLVDLARWAIASDTSPLVGTYKTRVSGADVVAGTATGSAVGLWTLGASPNLSAAKADLAARINVTPGFTPDDTWTLTWQGILPALSGRAAIFGRDGTTRWLAVQIGVTAPLREVADLDALGVGDGDLVEIGPIATYCPAGTEVAVTGAPTGSVASGFRVALVVSGSCLEGLPDSSREAVVATIRAKDLVLVGQKAGHAGRVTPVAASPTLSDALQFAGTRHFYVTDPCTSTECVAAWGGASWLTTGFPLPKGPAVGLVAGFIDAGGAIGAIPSRGTGITFTTASGIVPSGRRPIIKGTALASALPSGMALVDGGASGAGVQVWTSYTAGVVMGFSSAEAPGAVGVVR